MAMLCPHSLLRSHKCLSLGQDIEDEGSQTQETIGQRQEVSGKLLTIPSVLLRTAKHHYFFYSGKRMKTISPSSTIIMCPQCLPSLHQELLQRGNHWEERSKQCFEAKVRNFSSSEEESRSRMEQMFFASCLQIISPAVSDGEFQKYKTANRAVTSSNV